MVSTRQRIPWFKHISFHVPRVNKKVLPNHSPSWAIKQRTVFCDAMNFCLVVADMISYLFCLTLIQNSTNRYVGCDIKLLISMRLQGRPWRSILWDLSNGEKGSRVAELSICSVRVSPVCKLVSGICSQALISQMGNAGEMVGTTWCLV